MTFSFLSFANSEEEKSINTELNLSSKGFVRLVACQNRSRYIGKIGLHATEAIWKKWGFEEVKLRNYEFDVKNDTFFVKKKKEGKTT